MGVAKGIVHLFQDVTSFGGTFRIRADRDRYHRLVKANDQLYSRLNRYQAELIGTKIEIAKQIDFVRDHLRAADRMLSYAPGIGLNAALSPAVAESAQIHGHTELPFTPKPATSMKTAPSTIAGLGAGALTSGGTYGAAEILAHSTGKAAGMGLKSFIAKFGLFGIAGSVATTGALVAASPLLVTGIGAAALVTVSAAASHSRANVLARTCGKLEAAQKNRKWELTQIASEVQNLELLDAKLKNEDRVLAKAIESTWRRLLPFGTLSHLVRLVRRPFTGSYYKPEELAFLEELNQAVQRFVSAFRKRTTTNSTTTSVLS